MNGDGLADVAVSAAISGITYVVFGSRDGGDLDFRHLGARGFKISHAGHDVAGAGDVNGDGRDDIVVNGPYAAAVVYGKASTATVASMTDTP